MNQPSRITTPLFATPRLAAALVIAGALVLTGCSGGPLGSEPPAGDPDSTSAPAPDAEAPGSADAVGPDGIAIPGQVVSLQLGDPVTYYSFPKLSKDDVQTVTIHSFEYIDKSDLGPEAPLDKIDVGVLVLSLSWEAVMGSTQSNQGYVVATLGNGDRGTPLAFRDDRLRNGRVPLGETQTGTFTIAIDRGATTLTIVDYTDEPVARLQIDTTS